MPRNRSQTVRSSAAAGRGSSRQRVAKARRDQAALDFELAEAITKVTGINVRYRDLSVDEYKEALRRSGLDDNAAEFVAALDVSIARGDLETNSQDLEQLLGRPATSLADVIGEAYNHLA